MAHSELLLLKHVDNLGGEGDIVKVAAGYARNFLLPRKVAILSTHSNHKQIEALKKARASRESKELDGAKALGEKISGITITLAVKTGEHNKMFGSVTAHEVIEKLKEQGIELSKRALNLYHPFKDLGKHPVKAKLHKDVHVEFIVDIVSDAPVQANA